MDETLILKGLRGFETTKYTKYTERKRGKRLKWKLCETLILKGLMGFEPQNTQKTQKSAAHRTAEILETRRYAPEHEVLGNTQNTQKALPVWDLTTEHTEHTEKETTHLTN